MTRNHQKTYTTSFYWRLRQKLMLFLPLALSLHNHNILVSVQGFSASSRSSSSSSSTSGKSSPTQTSSTTSTNQVTTNLVFPGGGIFFNWQGGVISYLQENNYDLSACAFSGSSAGALTATLAATGVNFEEATALALDLAASPKYHVWDRPLGLQGVLQPLVEEWLDALVLPTSSRGPQSIVEEINQNQRLSILLTPVPLLWTKETKTRFENRQELIDSCLASIYLPFFSDGGLYKTVSNKPYIDGNFLSNGKHYKPTSTKKSKKKVAKRSNTIFLNWKRDKVLSTKYRGEDDLVATLQPKDIWDLVQQGKKYAKTLEAKGRFKSIPKLLDDKKVE